MFDPSYSKPISFNAPSANSRGSEAPQRKKRRRESSHEEVGISLRRKHHSVRSHAPPPEPLVVSTSVSVSRHLGNAEAFDFSSAGPSTSCEESQSSIVPQPSDEDTEPPTPTQANYPQDQSSQQFKRVFPATIKKEDTLMCIDPIQIPQPQPQVPDSSSLAVAPQHVQAQPDVPTAIIATMLDHLRNKQREDLEVFAQYIRGNVGLQNVELKNEVMRLRTEVVELQTQLQRMQQGWR